MISKLQMNPIPRKSFRYIRNLAEGLESVNRLLSNQVYYFDPLSNFDKNNSAD